MKDRYKQLAALKQQRAFLDAKINKLERMLFLPGVPSPPAEPAKQREYSLALKEHINRPDFTIEFDGGTSCNIPSKGFGKGYGSFKINDGAIKRVEFGYGHSCNSAEIRTLTAAIKELAGMCNPAQSVVLVRGDSRIALKWVTCKKQPALKTTPNFREAIEELHTALAAAKFRGIKTEWRGRQHSVQLFGH